MRAARIAGATPKIIPTSAEKPKANATDQKVTEVLMNRAIIKDPVAPSAIPMDPPTKLKIIASIKN